jgi:hypothetical protein
MKRVILALFAWFGVEPLDGVGQLGIWLLKSIGLLLDEQISGSELSMDKSPRAFSKIWTFGFGRPKNRNIRNSRNFESGPKGIDGFWKYL